MKNIFSVVPSPGDDRSLLGLASFDFRIVDVT